MPPVTPQHGRPALVAFLIGAFCSTAAVFSHAYDDFPGAWEAFPPPGQISGHVALIDSARDRLIVFGGQRNGVWTIASNGTGPWTRIADNPPPIGLFGGHRGILDAARDRIVVFGADGGRTWQLRLDQPLAWEELVTAGTPPAQRHGHSATYDPVRDRVIVFGGNTPARNDVWELTLGATPTWTQLLPTGTPPAARGSHTAVYDPVYDRLIVFGGYTGSSSLGDTWALNLGGTPSWFRISQGGAIPGPRYGHAAMLDAAGGRILLFGGYAGFDYYANDIYAYALATATWTQLAPAGGPPQGRADHDVAYDPDAGAMIVVGGYARSALSDLWSLDLGTTQGAWTWWNPTPISRWVPCAVYDPLSDRMVMYGGQAANGGPVLGELWALDATNGSHWEPLAATGGPPPIQFGQRAAYDPVRKRMIVFADSGTFLPEREIQTWALSLEGPPVWTQLEPTGTSPPAILLLASTIYDPVGDRMLLYGGNNSGVYNGNVYALDLAGGPAWSQLVTSGTSPPMRAGHSAVYDPVGERMLVFGGQGPSQSYSDLWALSLDATPTWSQIVPAGHAPPTLRWHSAIWDPLRGRMLVYGGYGNGPRGDVWEFDFSPSPVCSLLAPIGVRPPDRFGHVAVYDPVRDRMLVAAGFTYEVYNAQYAEAWGLDFHAAEPPSLACPVDLATSGGGAFSVLLENPFPSPQVFEVVLRSERAWPGFPVHTYVPMDPGEWSSVLLGETIPDSATGPVGLLVEAGLGYGSGYGAPATCWRTYRTGAAGGPPVSRIALQAAFPHPSREGIDVWLSLPDAAPATIETFDASGRRIARRAVGSLGAGRHLVQADGGKRPPPGVYFVRLARGTEAVTTRVLVVH